MTDLINGMKKKANGNWGNVLTGSFGGALGILCMLIMNSTNDVLDQCDDIRQKVIMLQLLLNKDDQKIDELRKDVTKNSETLDKIMEALYER